MEYKFAIIRTNLERGSRKAIAYGNDRQALLEGARLMQSEADQRSFDLGSTLYDYKVAEVR